MGKDKEFLLFKTFNNLFLYENILMFPQGKHTVHTNCKLLDYRIAFTSNDCGMN